jgi:hypothetical protein
MILSNTIFLNEGEYEYRASNFSYPIFETDKMKEDNGTLLNEKLPSLPVNARSVSGAPGEYKCNVAFEMAFLDESTTLPETILLYWE